MSSNDDGVTLPTRVKEAARRQLVQVGAAGLTLDAVAHDGGLSVAEVTGAFPDRDALLTALVIDAYDSSATEMERADETAKEAGEGAGARLLAATRALRAWSFANPGDFTLIYGSPVPGYHAPQDTVGPASRTPAVLAAIVLSALEAGELTPPRRSLPGPPLLLPAAEALFGGAPPAPYSDLLERGIALWSSLVGLLVFQVFSRTHDSVSDEVGYFDRAIAVAAEGIGLEVPLAASLGE